MAIDYGETAAREALKAAINAWASASGHTIEVRLAEPEVNSPDAS